MLPKNKINLFFQPVSRRYKRGSLLPPSSNRAAGKWGGVFGDPVVATAIFDQLQHHPHARTIQDDRCLPREQHCPRLIRSETQATENRKPNNNKENKRGDSSCRQGGNF
ncbi:ATP-binding protein [Desulfogranum mediterraneum]|uniref:ATP-binding protein n=1 Tax=Desulfogranum mediterraneum TaxID=160661 RepID=UPI001ABFAC43